MNQSRAAGIAGLRVLLAEDEMIIAMQIEDVLQQAGCEVVGPVGTVQAALALAQREALDAAVLDVNLDGERIFPAAEELHARGIPCILTTGYADLTLPEEWRELPRLTKPFRGEDLKQLIASVCGRASSQ